MKLIFGSTAVKHWFPNFTRNPNDLDYICENGKNSKGIEHHWNPAFQFILNNNKDPIYVDPNWLYTIKISHAAWDIRWDKTIKDIEFLKEQGCQLDYTLYKKLFKEWEIIHSKKKIKLVGEPKDFFTSKVTRKYNHDQLHDFVKFYENPLYKSLQKDENNVYCSKDLWNNLSHEDKIKCGLEEIYVFALERYSEFPPKTAKYKAMKQLITSSTKGYFCIFLIENFKELYYNDRDNYNNLYKQYKESQ